MFQRGRYGLNQGKEEGRLRLALFFCVEITILKGPFLPSDFTASKFSTTADKAEFGNTLLHFIESEWSSALFTKRFYNRRSIHGSVRSGPLAFFEIRKRTDARLWTCIGQSWTSNCPTAASG
jgi:hypothetical protein